MKIILNSVAALGLLTLSALATPAQAGDAGTLCETAPADAAGVSGSSGKATAPGDVNADQADIVLGAGKLILRGKRSADMESFDDGIRWDLTSADGETESRFGEASFNLPVGRYDLRATLGKACIELPIDIEPGKTVEKEIVVATGRIIAHALFSDGGPAMTGARFDILPAETSVDGSRHAIESRDETGATFDLAPGRYVLRATSGGATAETPFELTAGAPIEVPLVLNAGLLAVDAPDAERLSVLSDRKDIHGRQEELAGTNSPSWQYALPVGDYVVRVNQDDTDFDHPVSIRAGERTELKLQ